MYNLLMIFLSILLSGCKNDASLGYESKQQHEITKDTLINEGKTIIDKKNNSENFVFLKAKILSDYHVGETISILFTADEFDASNLTYEDYWIINLPKLLKKVTNNNQIINEIEKSMKSKDFILEETNLSLNTSCNDYDSIDLEIKPISPYVFSININYYNAL